MRPRILRLVDETYLQEMKDEPLETDPLVLECSMCETEFETDQYAEYCPNCEEQ